jgi:hypothetical protein
MKWTEFNPDAAGSRQIGKSALRMQIILAWLDWKERGSPPDEDVPVIEPVLLEV